MERNKKILMWVGIGSVLILGTGLFLYFRNNESGTAKPDEDADEKAPDTGENTVSNTQNHTNPPKGASYPPTPFKNTAEGNKFRAWVNKKYPAYAKANQLDPSGAFDNSFIRKAYLQYGAEYTKVVTPVSVPLAGSGFNAGDVVYLNPSTQSTVLYDYPQISGEYVKGTISKKDTLDRPIGKFIRVAIQGKTPSATWVKINVPSYKNTKNAIVNSSTDFYVLAMNISKAPF